MMIELEHLYGSHTVCIDGSTPTLVLTIPRVLRNTQSAMEILLTLYSNEIVIFGCQLYLNWSPSCLYSQTLNRFHIFNAVTAANRLFLGQCMIIK